MSDLEGTISRLIKSSEEVINTENLVVEAIEEMVKEEIKNHIRAKLEEDEELKNEFKESVQFLLEAKVKEGYAYTRLAKSSADLGFELIPDDLKEDMKKEMTQIMEEKMEEIMAE